MSPPVFSAETFAADKNSAEHDIAATASSERKRRRNFIGVIRTQTLLLRSSASHPRGRRQSAFNFNKMPHDRLHLTPAHTVGHRTPSARSRFTKAAAGIELTYIARTFSKTKRE